MKNITALMTGFLILACSTPSIAQDNNCVNCNGSTASGTYASAIGNKTTASGNHAFAGGYLSTASGSNSFAFGYNAKATQSTAIAFGNATQATGSGSIAIGNYAKATAKNAIAIGNGTTASYPLTNSVANSIAFGTNSNKPTLLITKATNNNYTGKVAIGPITSPTAKLHIKSDNSEDSGIFIETTNKTSRKAFIKLYDSDHVLSVDQTGTLSINAGTGKIGFSGEHYCFGNTNEKKLRMYTGPQSIIFHNAIRSDGRELRDADGTSCAIEFNNNGITFRVAEHQEPRGTVIDNWNEMLTLCPDGKIDIGAVPTSPITLTGKIGINTVNQVNDYALAVNGGIISTKVFIKEVNQWPDHVFSDNHTLMSFNELREYINKNHHLPGIPSEAEVVANGYDLHEMQYLMMEKIEELTCYILTLQKEIDSLKGANKSQNVQFTYDENGNRQSRSIWFKKDDRPGAPQLVVHNDLYRLFPNPTPGRFSLVITETAKQQSLRATLTTMTGVILEDLPIKDLRTEFDLSNQPDGLYLLEITGTEHAETWKVIKQ